MQSDMKLTVTEIIDPKSDDPMLLKQLKIEGVDLPAPIILDLRPGYKKLDYRAYYDTGDTQ